MQNTQEINQLKVGSSIPNISIPVFYNNKESVIQTNDLKESWLVLFFYPADFTFVCPTELSELADSYEAFKAENAEIISLSTDTIFTHKAWKDASETIAKVKFPMGADTNGKISKQFGVYLEEEGMALRGTFIIDPVGKIIAAEVNDNSIGRNAKELLRKLKAAKFVYKNGGNVCPASWQPGDETLKPSMDLVGKI